MLQKRFLLIIGFAFLIIACQRSMVFTPIAEKYEAGFKLDRFENEIKFREKTDSTIGIKNLQGQTIFYGSSSIRFWKTLKEDFAPLPVINHGFGGSTFPEMINFAERMIFAYHPKNVVIYCENDMFTGNIKTPEQTFDAFGVLATMIQNRLPKTKVYYISMKPSPLRKASWTKVSKADDLINSYIKKHKNFTYIDIRPVMYRSNGSINGDFFVSDSLHMKPAGYSEWTKIIRPFLLMKKG